MPSHNAQALTEPRSEKGERETFASLGLHPKTLAVARHLRWFVPTAVQKSVIPLALAGKDIVAVAPTGTGKTGAYGLPLHSLFETEKPRTEPNIPWSVVLVPTRELATQTARVLRSIFRGSEHEVAEVTGGVGFCAQRKHLSTGTAVLVATPGRCEDLVQRTDLRLEGVRHWVLDEMDRMLDYGFRATVKRLIRRAGTERRSQLLLFSATEGCVREVLQELGLRRAEQVGIFYQQQVPPALEEGVYCVSANRKLSLLEAMLQQWRPRRTLIFLSRRSEADNMVKKLNAGGLPSLSLHAEQSMTARREALERFTSGKHAVLVATDVVGRGLDVRGVELVAHLSVPATAQEYVHRSGRTARAGAPGRAVILASKDEMRQVERLERKLGRRLPRRRLSGFDYGPRPVGLRKIRVSLTGRAIGGMPNPKKPTIQQGAA